MNGYVIIAQNTKDINYIECADALALSIKRHNRNANITLISNDTTSLSIYDSVVNLPYGDLAANSEWKLINDWQVYDASPYEKTIKIEADVIVNSNLDYFFNFLNYKDICLCTEIRDYKGAVSDSRVYRKFIDDNKLPDVYNAITCFKKGNFAKTFFNNVRFVFENWDEIRKSFICENDEPATTDFVYAIVANVMGIENCMIPNKISMVHMKPFITNTKFEDWTKELIYEFEPFRIQKIQQSFPVHYNVKHFGKVIKEYYGRI
jgi:hypothetical protein